MLTGGRLSAGPDLTARRAAAGVFLPGYGPCVFGGIDGSRFLDTAQCREQPPGGPPFPVGMTPRAGLSASVVGSVLVTLGGFYVGHNGAGLVEVLPFTPN